MSLAYARASLTASRSCFRKASSCACLASSPRACASISCFRSKTVNTCAFMYVCMYVHLCVWTSFYAVALCVHVCIGFVFAAVASKNSGNLIGFTSRND